MTRLGASIAVVGDEILGGFVQDTNSGWLAQRLRSHGIPLDRIVTVPDDVVVIAAAVREELARGRPRLLLTSGGVGSTPDDVTLPGVARALGVDLVRQPDLDECISDVIARHAADGVALTQEHEEGLRRMALVPRGAYLLLPGDAFASGVAVDVDGGLDAPGGATVVVLPGVPALLRRITTEGVEPRLLAGRGLPDHVVEIAHPYPESMVNPALTQVLRRHPTVHLGSYPGVRCLVRLRGPQAEVEAAAGLVRAYLAGLDGTPGAARLREGWRQGWAGAGEGA